jgi:ketosteroid isomerase-like protein
MHENAEIVRRGYQAFNAADMKTLTELFDENASWHTPGRGSIAGDRLGRDAVLAQFGRYGGGDRRHLQGRTAPRACR